jgi:2,3-bisphosphoglycerate-independent phosphoglycerate mutase
MSAEKGKFVILVGDGLGDYPQDRLDGRTPLEAAVTPHMDLVASKGLLGFTQTVPLGCEPGSDIANLSLLGYDPLVYHTGRAPFEAISMGIRLGEGDVAFRCNLVHLDRLEGERFRMRSYSAGHIKSEEARPLIAALNARMERSDLTFYPGVSYRHILIWKGADPSVTTRPPHDLTGQEVTPLLDPNGESRAVAEVVRRSWPILADHPVNQARLHKGQPPADSIWLWGQGKTPSLPSFEERFGLKGGVISAVDLIKGIGLAAGLAALSVPGITGYLDSNFRGKAGKALDFLKDNDLVYVHVEAPDETSHEGSLEKKIQAIELFDREVVGPVLEGLKDFPLWSLMIATDHFTPLRVMTHTAEPVPFAVLRSQDLTKEGRKRGFGEREAYEGEVAMLKAHQLMPWFLKKNSA